MKFCLLITFLLLSLVSKTAPQLQGYEFKSIMEFGLDVKARVAKDCFYTAERLAGNKIEVTKYDLKCKYVSAETIDIMAEQNDYKTFSIVDFEVGWNGQVVVIGQGNKTDNLKKQKCYLIHYTPGSSIITKEIEDRIYLYQNLLFENGVFYFCGAAGEVESNGRYEIWRNSYKYVQGSKELSSDFILGDSKEDLDITESSVWAKNCWYSGDRYVISQHTASPLNVTVNYNTLTFPGSNGVAESKDRLYLHQVEVYDFSPFGEWFVAFCSHPGNNGWISEAYTSEGKLMQFVNEPFQDMFIDPETKAPCLITTKGVYRILVTYDQAVKMAEKKMLSELSKWKTRGQLETESEVTYRVAKDGQKFSDSTLTTEVNKLLPIMNMGVYNEAKFQSEFNSLRLKLTTLDDYFYTVNWNASQTNFEEPVLKKLLIEYEQGKPVLRGFDYMIKNKNFVARRLLPPKIMKESIYIEKVGDFETRFTVDFISKSKNNSVRFLVDDIPVTAAVKGLGNDQFQVVAPVKFTTHTAKLKMIVACELGDTIFEYKLECENIYDSKEQNCFTAYYDELATGFVNPVDMVEAMNVCIIVSNSNFYQADSSVAGEIPLAENIQQAQILQNILVTNYHFKNEQVLILQDQTKEQMDELFVQLEDIGNSDYASKKGASKINLMLVVLSHGSADNKLITSDNKKFDISKAIIDLNYKSGFNDYVQDFLYIEDMCFGSFKQDKTLRGNKIDMNFKPDFCHYADKGSKVGVMSSLDGLKVSGSVFIRNFNKALEANKNSEVVTLETILMTMVTNKDLTDLPLILKLYQDIGNTKAQKSFYFFTDKYLQTQIH